MINKSHYFQTYVTGYAIKNHMKDKSVFKVEVINSILDGKEVKFFSMKDLNYVMILILSYGNLKEGSTTEL